MELTQILGHPGAFQVGPPDAAAALQRGGSEPAQPAAGAAGAAEKAGLLERGVSAPVAGGEGTVASPGLLPPPPGTLERLVSAGVELGRELSRAGSRGGVRVGLYPIVSLSL